MTSENEAVLEQDFVKEEVEEDVYKLLEEGNSIDSISQELELPKKDITDIYEEWKKLKMDKLELGDKVCFILNIEGYDSQLVHGTVHSKHTNSVVVDCKDNAYVRKVLRGRVAVSVKDVLKVHI